MGFLDVIDPAGFFGGGGNEALNRFFDPLDLAGTRSGSALKEGEMKQKLATLGAMQARRRMFEKAKEIGEPYRKIGYEALTGLTESLDPESALGSLRSDITRNFMSKFLQGKGFEEGTAKAVTGERLRRTKAAEDVSRRGRAGDLMSLGAGQTAQGMGMAGVQGRSQAQNILAGAAAQANILAQESAGRRAMTGAAMYGGQRMMGDYLARREADKYGGYYG